MQSKSFLITTCQFSFYTPNLQFSANKILEGILQKYGDVFTGDTVVVPLPPDAPKEIPRIILQSKDSKFKIDISENRVSLFRNQQENETVDLKSFLSLCLKVLASYKELSKASIGRLALVAVRYLENKSPGKTLAGHFCKEEWMESPFNRPENFEIHSHKKYTKEGFNVNSWVRCKTGNLKSGNAPIIVVVQDINTLAEELEKNDFGPSEAEKFITFAQNEQDSILKLYFPDKQ